MELNPLLSRQHHLTSNDGTLAVGAGVLGVTSLEALVPAVVALEPFPVVVAANFASQSEDAPCSKFLFKSNRFTTDTRYSILSKK